MIWVVNFLQLTMIDISYKYFWLYNIDIQIPVSVYLHIHFCLNVPNLQNHHCLIQPCLITNQYVALKLHWYPGIYAPYPDILYVYFIFNFVIVGIFRCTHANSHGKVFVIPWVMIWLTHWGRDKMAAIFRTTFSIAFSWRKNYEFHILLSLFLRNNNMPALVQIIAWRRSGDKPLSEPVMA